MAADPAPWPSSALDLGAQVEDPGLELVLLRLELVAVSTSGVRSWVV